MAQSITKDKVKAMLKHYNENQARCSFLAEEIRRLRVLLINEERIEKESGYITTSQLTGMPRGTNISDPTAREGTKLADGIIPQYLIELRSDLVSSVDELAEKAYEVKCVQAWLIALNAKELIVLETQYINSRSWKDTASEYQNKIGYLVSQKTLKRIRDVAMNRIYSVVNIQQ